MTADKRPNHRVLIAAGGTGGHVFPALAIAEELRRMNAEVCWLGCGGIETREAPACGLPLLLVPFRPPAGVSGAWRLLVAVWRARRLLQSWRPTVILAMGSYAALPGALAGRLLGVPLVLHEQNAIAGRANKLLQKIACRIFTGFPTSLPGGEWVGNPTRLDFGRAAQEKATAGPLHLLILGGSQGAQALNEMVPAALGLTAAEFIIAHQCGRGRRAETIAGYQKAGCHAEVVEFMNDVARRMAAADLVICRAGAATLAELAVCGTPALLVPYPFAAANHQLANAEFFARRGAAYLREQKELSPAWLADFLPTLSRAALMTMRRQMLMLARPEAAAQVAAGCLEKAYHAA